MQLIKKTLLECKVGGSNKFWEISLYKIEANGNLLIKTRWGKISLFNDWKNKGGTESTLKELIQEKGAHHYYNEKIKGKLAKGYQEVKVRAKSSEVKTSPEDNGLSRFSSMMDDI